ncbi:AMP-binding protein [Trinickia mobilis]|uniref:AMP-binding protein n=1 Tax=Trinickia mobilis TaxID=2816356 RepID=UPI001A8C65F0|nr:AMP-binding protein [Trinickia mobilis]
MSTTVTPIATPVAATPAAGAAATVRELIDERAAQCPAKPFLLACRDDGGASVEDGTETRAPAAALTFGELREHCRALEAQFHAAGLRPGDAVSVFMGNGIQTARLLLAAMYSGLVANPLNLLCQPSQLRYIVEHSDTRAIFVAPDTREAAANALAQLRAEGVAREIALIETQADAEALPVFAPAERDGACRALPLDRAAEPAAADVALLMYTSGTTGAPKGVLLTHRNLLANARNITAEHRLTAGDRVLASLPLYHINGLVVTLLAPLYHGGSVVMAPRFSARTFWRDAARHGCTWINVVPTIVAYLLNGGEEGASDLRSLRFCRSASAALPAEHHRAFEARFGIGLIETMGLTETAAPAFSNPYDPSRRRIGSIGLPAGCEAKVIDLNGSECAAHACGEIVLRGEQVMRGYYKRPEETRAAFTADGWLRTGDLGYRDADGYFYINGRAKELIIKGGENIAPREIDEALLKHPGVLEAAAVGVPDAAYGQEIVAFVVPRDRSRPLDIDELRAHCLRELGRYKTPKEFRFVDDLPRGPSGKVQRLKLLQT